MTTYITASSLGWCNTPKYRCTIRSTKSQYTYFSFEIRDLIKVFFPDTILTKSPKSDQFWPQEGDKLSSKRVSLVPSETSTKYLGNIQSKQGSTLGWEWRQTFIAWVVCLWGLGYGRYRFYRFVISWKADKWRHHVFIQCLFWLITIKLKGHVLWGPGLPGAQCWGSAQVYFSWKRRLLSGVVDQSSSYT